MNSTRKNHDVLTTFIKYTSLNITGMIALSCYILADTFFVSKGLGMTGVAALNLAIPIYSFLHGCALMFGMGGATRYAILKSQKNDKAASAAFTNSFLAALGLGIIFLLFGVFYSDTITSLLGANQNVFSMTNTYIKTILLFAPMFLLNEVFICFVRNDANPRLSMIAMIGGSFSNILLDWLFIFPFGMGMFGAVLATGLAPVISICILSIHYFKKKQHFHFIKQFAFKRMFRKMIAIGLPSFITEFSSGIVIVMFNVLILNLQGNTGVAAYGIIANLSLVVVAAYSGVAQGVQPIISRFIGEGKDKDIYLVLRYACITMLAISAFVYAVILFGNDVITSVFNSEHNPTLQQIATRGLCIYFTASPFIGFNIVLSTYFTSIGKPRPAHIISVLRGFVIIMPLSMLLSSCFGMDGIWLTLPLCEFIVAVITAMLFLFMHRKKGECV